MPYKVVERDGEYDVVNTVTDEVKATHAQMEAAENQVKLLNELEKEAE